MKKAEWFIDKDSENRWIYHKIKKYILSTKTQFQKVDIIETEGFGRIVVLDKKIQSAEKDEFIYHEALVHPAMILHQRPERILILGGGEGATLREVLKHPTVKHTAMIDIDREFVDLCKKYLHGWHMNSFNDPKVQLIIEDAMEYIKKTKSKYDVIIADISDPIEEGPAMLIYTERFYSLVRKALKSDGIFVTHATDIDYTDSKRVCTQVLKAVRKIFPISAFYYEYIPSFDSLWAFAIGSLKHSPANLSVPTLKKRLEARKLGNLSYYDHETHKRMFSIPKCIKRLLHF
ncbi:MAG: polyamine aminopropyltransferase [Nitrospirae bacterium]|jgi:spermidine synthase|nr:polyamine aminopropyltransferase [Nitrospirota bacterium]